MFKGLQQIIDRFRRLVEKEWELVKLKSVLTLARLIANAYAFIFLAIFINITLVLVGLFIGFWLTELTGSFMEGFGLSAALFVLLSILLLVFRKALLVRPFANALLHFYQKIQKERASEAEGLFPQQKPKKGNHGR